MVSFSRVYDILEPRLREHEGVRFMPYRDSKGLLTIGVGRCLETKGLSAKEVDYLLDNDMVDSVMSVVRSIPWAQDLDEDRFSVLAEMAFQMGIGGLLGFKVFLELLKVGYYEKAADEMLDSKWAKEDSPKRALELSDIIRGVKE
jgi:lysozyme